MQRREQDRTKRDRIHNTIDDMQHVDAAGFVVGAPSVDAAARPVLLLLPLSMVLPLMLLLPCASLASCYNVFSEMQATGNCRRRRPILVDNDVLCR